MRQGRLLKRTLDVVVFGAFAVAVGSCTDATAPPSTLSAPTDVTVTLVSATSARVSWTASAETDQVVSYNVLRDGTKIAEPTITSYLDNNLVEGATYKYRISANGKLGLVSEQSAESPSATITVPDATPPAVMSTTPAAGATGMSLTASITASFSEPLDPTSVNTTTFVVRSGVGAPVPGIVSYTAATRTAEFRPSPSLPNGANVLVTITTGIKDAAGNRLPSDFTFSFSTRDEAPPNVVSTSPANGATGVAGTSTVAVTFNKLIDAATLNAASFTVSVTSGGTPISGNISFDATSRTGTFTPTEPLASATSYTATIASTVKDLSGNALATAYSFSFITAAGSDVTPPTVIATSPAAGAANVGANTTFTATFSEPMDVATINSATIALRVSATSAPVTGTVTYNATTNTVTFTPTGPLSGGTSYSATVTTAARDVAGNGLAATYEWSFTTVDNSAPTVTSVSPANGSVNIPVNSTVTVAFSEPMDAATINSATITLTNNSTATTVAGAVSYNSANNTATFSPSSALSFSTGYTVSVSTAVKDAAGNAMAATFSATFSTAGAPDTTPPSVLGTSPDNGAGNVAVTAVVTATFSEQMDAATISGSTVTLKVSANGAAVAGTVTYNAGTNTATFTPSSALAYSTGYTLTVSTGAKDLAGNSLATAFTSSFTTTTAPDTTPPTVTSTVPANDATNIAITSVVTVTFSEPMDPSSINGSTITLKVTSSGAPVSGSVTYNGANNTATFTPSASLSYSTGYTLTVSTGVKDAAGNALATTFTSGFSTVAAPDTTPPTVVSTVPPNGATGVPVNSAMTVTFSEPMNAGTVNTNTVTLKVTSSGASVSGTVGYNSGTNTATFTPSAALAFNIGYTLTVTTGAQDVAGNGLATTFTSTFTTAAAPDITPPTVTSTIPANGATNVAIGTTVSVIFSEAMDAATINGTNITLKNTATSGGVAGTVSYNAGTNTATFTPTSPLSYSTNYTLTVSTGVKDLAGNALAATFSSSFTTLAAPDTTPPTVISTSPANGAVNVPIGTTVTVTFSEAMNPATINGSTITLKVTSSGAGVSGTVSYSAGTNSATFTPSSALAYSTGYTLTVTTGVQDVAGNAMATQFTAGFTTVPPPDTTPPTVIGNSPANGATNVAVNVAPTVTFSEAMNAGTINTSTITLKVTSSGTSVSGTVSYNGGTNTATFTPSSALSYLTGYTLTVSPGVRDLAGNAMANTFSSSFTTAPPPDTTPPTVNSTSPANSAVGVLPSSVVTVTFSEAMNASTINSSSVTLKVTSSGTSVAGTVTYNSGNNTATFTPSAALAYATNYTLTVTTAVTDLAGNPIAATFNSSFTTIQNVADMPYFQGTDAGDRIHFHITFTQDGQTLGVIPNCESLPLANCGMFPLNPEGADIIGPESPNMNGGAMIVGITGTVTDPGITFTVTLENGRTFTFTGTVANSNAMTLVVSGATLPATDLVLTR
jgi:ATP-dependent Clp protease adapter protein ClpS